MPLPFILPSVSRGFALLAPPARSAGRAALDAAAGAVGALLGVPVQITATPLAPPARRGGPGLARVGFCLEAVGAGAWLEVDAALVARALRRLAGASGALPAVLAATEAESSVLELLALVAIDAVTSTPAGALVPRLASEPPSQLLTGGALAIDLQLQLGPDRGTARLLIDPAAIAHLAAGAPELPEAAAFAQVGCSLRDGACSLALEELAPLAPGDVLVLDHPAPPAALVLPGGLEVRGRRESHFLHVEEIRMTETQASYPITLAVEIARVNVTLGELARLEPGAALPLDVRADGTVVLRAGERAVARGQLVDLGGTLGVRIAEVGALP